MSKIINVTEQKLLSVKELMAYLNVGYDIM